MISGGASLLGATSKGAGAPAGGGTSIPPVAGDVLRGAGGEAAPGVCAWPAVAAAIPARRTKAALRQRPSETRKFAAAERRNMTCTPALLPVVSTGEDFTRSVVGTPTALPQIPTTIGLNRDGQGSDDMEPDSTCSRFNHAFSLNY